jgi:hypothetical protein
MYIYLYLFLFVFFLPKKKNKNSLFFSEKISIYVFMKKKTQLENYRWRINYYAAVQRVMTRPGPDHFNSRTVQVVVVVNFQVFFLFPFLTIVVTRTCYQRRWKTKTTTKNQTNPLKITQWLPARMLINVKFSCLLYTGSSSTYIEERLIASRWPIDLYQSTRQVFK